MVVRHLLADGIITPPISITSAIEGLKQLHSLKDIEQTTIVGIVIGIISILFFMQQFGTASIGKLFGPIMGIWFAMLAVLGSIHLVDDIGIFKALSPHYAIKLLTTYPKGFWLLGLCFYVQQEPKHCTVILGIADAAISVYPGYL